MVGADVYLTAQPNPERCLDDVPRAIQGVLSRCATDAPATPDGPERAALYGAGETLQGLAFPDLAIPLADIFAVEE